MEGIHFVMQGIHDIMKSFHFVMQGLQIVKQYLHKTLNQQFFSDMTKYISTLSLLQGLNAFWSKIEVQNKMQNLEPKPKFVYVTQASHDICKDFEYLEASVEA